MKALVLLLFFGLAAGCATNPNKPTEPEPKKKSRWEDDRHLNPHWEHRLDRHDRHENKNYRKSCDNQKLKKYYRYAVVEICEESGNTSVLLDS